MCRGYFLASWKTGFHLACIAETKICPIHSPPTLERLTHTHKKAKPTLPPAWPAPPLSPLPPAAAAAAGAGGLGGPTGTAAASVVVVAAANGAGPEARGGWSKKEAKKESKTTR